MKKNSFKVNEFHLYLSRLLFFKTFHLLFRFNVDLKLSDVCEFTHEC